LNVTTPGSPTPRDATEAARLEAPRRSGRGVGAEPIAQHLGELVESELPLPDGLRALGAELRDKRERAALMQLAEEIEAGRSLDEALATQGDRFPAHLRGLIVAGLRTGRLAEVLGGFVGEGDLGATIRRRLWLSLLYPALLALTALAFVGVLSAYGASDIGPVLRDFGINLPGLSLDLLSVVETIGRVGPWLILGIWLAALAGWVLGRLLFTPTERRLFLHRLPLIGPIWRDTALADFCRLLAWLLDAQVPLGEALTLAGGGVRDPVLADACRSAASGIERGQPLSEAVGAHPAFPPGLAPLLRWAESLRSPAQVARLAGAIFEARARAGARFAAIFVAVLVVVAVLWGMLIFVGAVIWPMMHLLHALTV
jgi:type II secretory pathway component PulF